MSLEKKALYLSPLPPPSGGIATWMDKIIKKGLPNNYTANVINTNIKGSRPVFATASLSLTEIYRTASIILRLLFQIIFTRQDIAHVNCSLSATGVIRELICVVLIRARGIPIITHHHGNLPNFPLPNLPKDKFGGLSMWALRKIINYSRYNIVLNKPSEIYCSSLINDPSKCHCTLLPNFIESSVLEYETNKNKTKKDESIQVIFVGGLVKDKGINDIIEVSKHLPEIKFNLVGYNHLSDPEQNHLPDNICIVGSLPYEEVIKQVSRSDIFFFPSLSEGFPLSVLEAMSLELPVVSTYVGAIPEMIDDGKGGMLKQPGDITGFIEAISDLASNQELRKDFGRYNKEKCIKLYNYNTVTEQLTNIYDIVITKHQLK